MKMVRIGIIGLGTIGSYHAEYLAAGDIEGACLGAVSDTHNPAQMQWATELANGVQAFDSPDELMASGAVDAVILATPHYFHPPLAVKAFNHGLHVLTEKPAGVYTRQILEMNDAAKASGCAFTIMFHLRTVPLWCKVRDLIQSGEIGRIQRNSWICTKWFRPQCYYDAGGWRATWKGEGGGVLINQCPHNLDMWQWLCGVPSRVRAFCHFGKYHDIEVEDEVTAYVEYDDGASGVFIASTGEAPGTDRLELTGDRGKLVVEDNAIRFWRTRTPVSEFNRNYQGGFGEPEHWVFDIPATGRCEMNKGVTRDFVNAIREGRTPNIPGAEGLNSVEISNAMLLSTWTDDWVDIPVDADRFYDILQDRIANSKVQKDAASTRVMNAGKSWHNR